MTKSRTWASSAAKAALAVIVAAMFAVATAGAAYASQFTLIATPAGADEVLVTNAETATNNVIETVSVKGTASNVELNSADDATDAANQVADAAIAIEMTKLEADAWKYTDVQLAQERAKIQNKWAQTAVDYGK